MIGDIVKLKSGRLGAMYFGDRYAIVSNEYRKLLPEQRTATPYPGEVDTVVLTTDPVVSTLPRTKESTLSIATALPRISIIGGVTSGTDPEIFCFSKEGDVIPAWKFLPPKDKAIVTHRNFGTYYREEDAKSCTQVHCYWDGVQAELNMTRGEGCHAQLVDNIRYGLKAIYDAAQKFSPGAYLETRDVVKLDEQTLVEASEEHVALGCAPSDNAYRNIRPIHIEDPRSHLIRYSGAHLHFRSTTFLKTSKILDNSTFSILPSWFPGGTIKMMDRVLGLLLTALGRDLENPLRRKAYGRPGEFRKTDTAGIEYRTPSSFIMCHPAVMNFALDMGRRAFGLGMLYDPDTFFLPGAKDVILSCDADEAVKRIEKFAPFFEQLFVANNGWDPKGTMHILRKGLKACNLVGNVTDNWNLNKDWTNHNNADRADFRTMSAAAAKL